MGGLGSGPGAAPAADPPLVQVQRGYVVVTLYGHHRAVYLEQMRLPQRMPLRPLRLVMSVPQARMFARALATNAQLLERTQLIDQWWDTLPRAND